MTAMLILNAIGMTLIATAIVSVLAWAIISQSRPRPRSARPRPYRPSPEPARGRSRLTAWLTS